MSKYCEDCGTRTANGVCPNCQEELYIMENQMQDIDMKYPVSDEFAKTVTEQIQFLKQKRKGKINYDV